MENISQESVERGRHGPRDEPVRIAAEPLEGPFTGRLWNFSPGVDGDPANGGGKGGSITFSHKGGTILELNSAGQFIFRGEVKEDVDGVYDAFRCFLHGAKVTADEGASYTPRNTGKE